MAPVAQTPASSPPKWLITSAASEGSVSGLCPKEEQWTGTGQGWSITHHSSYSSYTTNPPLPSISTRSPASRSSNLPSILNTHFQETPRIPAPPASQAAPLKAQLLAILRLRSNSVPGEASLKFKKWVLWNAWIRRSHVQMAFHPMMADGSRHSGALPMRTTTDLFSATGQAKSERDWTGDEVFDENGDLVCSDEEGTDNDLDGKGEEPQWLSRQSSETTVVVDRERLDQNESVIRLRLPSAGGPAKFALHPTPPASPVSEEDRGGKDRWKGFQGSDPSGLAEPDATDQYGIRRAALDVEDQRPPTPPPSPPNETRDYK